MIVFVALLLCLSIFGLIRRRWTEVPWWLIILPLLPLMVLVALYK